MLCRACSSIAEPLDDRIHVGHGNEDLHLVAGHGLRHGKLVQVAGVVVVDGSPQEVPEVTNLTSVRGCRGLNPAEFGQCFGREVGEQSPFEPSPSGRFSAKWHGAVRRSHSSDSPIAFSRRLQVLSAQTCSDEALGDGS